jgi:hypothetical protein
LDIVIFTAVMRAICLFTTMKDRDTAILQHRAT